MRSYFQNSKTLNHVVLKAIAIVMVVFSTSFANRLLAQDKKPFANPTKSSDQPAEKPTDPFQVPKGTPEELLDYIRDLFTARPAVNNRDELIEHFTKVTVAVAEASDKILADPKADKETTLTAVSAKFQALSIRLRLGNTLALKQMAEYAKQLQKDKRTELAEAGDRQYLIARVQSLADLEQKQQQQLVEDVVDYIQAAEVGEFEFSLGTTVARQLEQFDQNKLAAILYKSMANAFAKSASPRVRLFADKMKGSARRNRLPGNPIELIGKTLDGEEFDWASYKGKVVLVDFWATWCGPCVQELPNVLANYDRYHERGFEVVGISLDQNRAVLEDFLEQRQVPWVTLFSDNPREQRWDNPNATYYGVMGIPTTILVDRNGKVISLAARGPELGRLLKKLLRSSDKKPASGGE